MHHRHANSYFAANLIAADERHAANLERIERLRAYRESETTSDVPKTTLRVSLGLALIRLGQRLGGGPAPVPSLLTSAG